MNNPVALMPRSIERVHDALEVAFHPKRGCVGTRAQAGYSGTSVGVAPWPWRKGMVTCVLVGERGVLSGPGAHPANTVRQGTRSGIMEERSGGRDRDTQSKS
jgi:hypothetical protein